MVDPFDNCPRAANPDQRDDDDGVGNVCFIPEPDPALLLATGLAFLATVGRRRMKA